MKKIFIIFIVIIVLLIIGGILGYFYYDKYVRYGRALGTRDVSLSDGFYFDESVSEKIMGFSTSSNGNFTISIDKFSLAETASRSLESKSKIYSSLVESNGGNIFEKDLSGYKSFIIKFINNSNLIAVQINDKIIQVMNDDRSGEETEKFIKWFIKYWAK